MQSFSRYLPAALLFFLLLASSPSRAGVEEISVGVNGVTCPVCTHSLNIGLRTIRGVKSVKVSLATRVRLDVTLHAGAWVEPDRIFQRIRELGYQPRQDEVLFRLKGRVTKSENQLLLTLTDVGSRPIQLLLSTPPQSDGKNEKEVCQAIAELEKTLDAGRDVEIEGWWRPASWSGDPLPSLIPTRLRF